MMNDEINAKKVELSQQFAEAMQSGDTRQALTVADAFIIIMLQEINDRQRIEEGDMQQLVVLLAGAIRALIHRDLNDLSHLFI